MIAGYFKYLLSKITGRARLLPILILMPHSRCNCRCVMCDIWKANQESREISVADLKPHIDAFRRLGVKRVMLSGGEPLMHSNLWSFCAELKAIQARITLLSTGLLLDRHARQIRTMCDEVIVSLDGSREVHDKIRNVPGAFARLETGVASLKGIDAAFPVTGRSVVQRGNYADILNIVEAARAIGLDRISFLAADVFSTAFNRPVPWVAERASEIALARDDVPRFADLIERLIERHDADIRSGFIVESAEKLRRLPAYFAASHGLVDFPRNRCNAPWVSLVIEADGTLRPCFFHRALGNMAQGPLDRVVNSSAAAGFRRNLNVARDPVCRKCVCTLYLNPLGDL